MNNHICGDPNSACDAECMDLAHRAELRTKEETVPKGVVAVFVHDGHVIAYSADFNRSTPGGFTTREAQSSRARMALGKEVVRALASPRLSEPLDSYECERIMNKLGGKVAVVPVGWTEDEE